MPEYLEELSDADLRRKIRNLRIELDTILREGGEASALSKKLDTFENERQRRLREQNLGALKNGETIPLTEEEFPVPDEFWMVRPDGMDGLDMINADLLWERALLELTDTDQRPNQAGEELPDLVADDERGGHWVRFFDFWVYRQDFHVHMKRYLALKAQAESFDWHYEPPPELDLSDEQTWLIEKAIVDEIEAQAALVLKKRRRVANRPDLSRMSDMDRITFAIEKIIESGQLGEDMTRHLAALISPEGLAMLGLFIAGALILAWPGGWAAAAVLIGGLLLMFGEPLIHMLSALYTLLTAETVDAYERGIAELSDAFAALGVNFLLFIVSAGGARISARTAGGRLPRRGRRPAARPRGTTPTVARPPMRLSLRDMLKIKEAAVARHQRPPSSRNITRNVERLRELQRQAEGRQPPPEKVLELTDLAPPTEPAIPRRAAPTPESAPFPGRIRKPPGPPPQLPEQHFPIQKTPRGRVYQQREWGGQIYERRLIKVRGRYRWSSWRTPHDWRISRIGIRGWVKDMLKARWGDQFGTTRPKGWQWRHTGSKRIARRTYELLENRHLIEIILNKLHKFHVREGWRRLGDTRSPWKSINRETIYRWAIESADNPRAFRERLIELATDLHYNDPAYIWLGPGEWNQLLGRHISGGRNPALDLDFPIEWNLRPRHGDLMRYGPKPTYRGVLHELARYLRRQHMTGQVVR